MGRLCDGGRFRVYLSAGFHPKVRHSGRRKAIANAAYYRCLRGRFTSLQVATRIQPHEPRPTSAPSFGIGGVDYFEQAIQDLLEAGELWTGPGFLPLDTIKARVDLQMKQRVGFDVQSHSIRLCEFRWKWSGDFVQGSVKVIPGRDAKVHPDWCVYCRHLGLVRLTCKWRWPKSQEGAISFRVGRSACNL